MAGRETATFDPLPRIGGPGGPPSEARPLTLVGLPPGARALALLSVQRAARRPLVVVTRSQAEAASIARDLRAFDVVTGGPGGDAVGCFPPLEADPWDGLATHLATVCARLRCLWSLERGAARILVAGARALLLPLPPWEVLSPFFRTIREGDSFPEADDDEWFRAAGYRRADLVTEPGDVARRGGILDLFAPIHDEPVRIELDGTRVQSLRCFSAADQRSTRRLTEVTLSPARETILRDGDLARLSAAIRRDADGRRLIEQIETRGSFPGISACARLIYADARGPIDMLTAAQGSPLLVVDEPEMTLEQCRQDRAAFLRAAQGSEALGTPEALMEPQESIEKAIEAAACHMRQLDIRAAVEEDDPVAASPPAGRAVARFQATGMPSYRGRIEALTADIAAWRAAGETVWVVMRSEGRAHRMSGLLREAGLEAAAWEPGRDEGLYVLSPSPRGAPGAAPGIGGGFVLPEARLVVIAEQEIFGEERPVRRRSAIPTFTSDFRDLNPGDLVVHVDHGVGRYEGLTRLPGDGQEVDVMVLSYHGADKLFVPVTRLDLVQKYSGVGGRAPTLDRLGGTGWTRTRQRVSKAMKDMAVELLNLYAARRTIEGHAFPQDTEWQGDFEAAFPWELTPDQQIAVRDIKRDLESTVPMDRLLCGDVGFGKTEVAMRAAFKVVMDGRQVAVLAPTTVLTFQHANTFRERFAAFPARIESLSRFRTPKDQKAIVAAVAGGAVDIVIGTHRLLSKDVTFRNLGLLIVDEEQRFGVAHKERIKQFRKNVDVLTLTATPIPRTLQMSLMGVRDLSVIETAPENRLAIQTHLVPFKEPIITAAIRNELDRDGQIYFVHNRIDSVSAMGKHLSRLVPEARIGVAHGQLPERELESTMMRFLKGEFNVLLSTTIIENGLDIPRVNTLIVNRADTFGLAQLYQLRGRIGRSDRQAYAYLLVPPERTLTEVARRRLKALQEFSDLGSGFRIAAMDLEIRGAGNLLGAAQHGHIAALGFELYCRMLERAVQDLRQEGEPIPETRASINLGIDLMIPGDYIADEHHRLMFYKKIASAAAREDLDRIRDEMEDRYGRLPRQGANLLAVAELRILGESLHVKQLDYRSGRIIVKFSETSPVEPDRLLRFVSRRSDATFSPPAVLRLKVGREDRGERAEAERIQIAREVITSLA